MNARIICDGELRIFATPSVLEPGYYHLYENDLRGADLGLMSAELVDRMDSQGEV